MLDFWGVFFWILSTTHGSRDLRQVKTLGQRCKASNYQPMGGATLDTTSKWRSYQSRALDTLGESGWRGWFFCLFVVGDFEVEVTLDGFTVGTLATCCCSFRWCQMKCFFQVLEPTHLHWCWTSVHVGARSFHSMQDFIHFHPHMFFPFDSWRPNNIVLNFRSQRLMLLDWKIYPKAVEGHWLLYLADTLFLQTTDNVTSPQMVV